MAFDEERERETDEDRPPGFLWWLGAMVVGAALWVVVWYFMGWLVGAP